MDVFLVPFAVTVATLAVVFVAYLALLRGGHHYTSRLTCPKCQRSFDYKWIPGAAFSAVRLGKSRLVRCPLCHEWSTFDVMATRVESRTVGVQGEGQQSSGPTSS